MLPRAPLSRTVKLISGTLTATLFVLCCAAPALAQDATPAATLPVIVITATPTVPSPTPTVTSTPTVTPTPTATFTALQARLALGQAYLKGGDFGKAAEIFSAVALEDRGNSEALAGLDAALKGQAAATATAAAPPTAEVVVTPAPTGSTAADTFREQAVAFGATALALLLVVLTLYLAARALRWLLGWLREFWFTRIRRPPVPPGLVIGELADATGEEGSPAARVVAQALTEQLVTWNSAAPPELQTPLQTDGLNRPGLAWVRALWEQVFPPRRAYRLSGVLSGKQPGPYRLALDRLDLRSNRVDASRTFESGAQTPAQAFRELGMTAAFWARDPLGMEGTPGLLEMPARAAGLTGAAHSEEQPTPAQTAGEALKLLAQVLAQVQGINVDYTTAPHVLEEAQSLIEQLPAASKLRADLQLAADDLWRQVQPGRAGHVHS
jgi:hypothetical protein